MLCRRLVRSGWRGLSRAAHQIEDTTSPSTSRETRRGEIQSFVDSVKSSFPGELESLNTSILAADAERRNMCKQDHSDFLNLISKSVIGSDARLIPVGSSVNGLCGISSDLDLVFFPTKRSTREQFIRDFYKYFDFRGQFMATLSELISRAVATDGISVVTKKVYANGRVPLLALVLSNGLHVDVQFPDDNFHAVRNSNLIRLYTQCDERLGQLFVWLRAVADATEIRNSKVGLMSTYHLLLLIIHFLQCEKCLSPWPVLPTIYTTHPHLAGREIPIDDVIAALEKSPPDDMGWVSHNKMSVAELAVRFVDYYASFVPESTVIFIERGREMRRKQPAGPVVLQLVDPYSKHTVSRSPYIAKSFSDAMKFLKRKMKRGQFIDSFPTFSEASTFRMETQWEPWRMHLEEKKRQQTISDT